MQSKVKTDSLDINEKELLVSLNDHLVISISDTNGRIVYSNKNFSEVFGTSQKNDIGQANQLLKSLTHSKLLYWEIWKTIITGDKWKGVLFYKSNNHTSFWFETTITPLKDDHGNIIKYLTVSSDITSYYCNKTDNNNPIYNKEKRLIGNLTEDVLFITKQGKIFNVSQSVLNKTNESIVGAYVYDFTNPDNHGYIKKQINRVFNEGKTCEYQSIGLSPKGNQIFFITKIKPVFNFHNEVIYATLKSTKNKNNIKINNQLKAIESKYSNIFQSINVGIIVVANSKGNIIEWNKGAEQAFGYTSSEIIGEHLTALISKSHVNTGIKELLKAKDKLDNNLNGENIEMIGLRKNGQEFPVEFAMSHWRNGKEKFYCAIMLDISRRKKLEEKLKKTTKDLELFLYRSAHDLKAPLTSAEGLLLLLKEEKLNKKASLLVNMLDETLEKGRLLLDDLAFASIISEKRREINPVNFEKNINKALVALKGIENFETINFHIDIQQKSLFYFNLELIDSIFQNLIHNTIIYAKAKSMNHEPTVKVQVKTSEELTSIVVSDNGLGIDNNHIDRVFDLYFKGNSEISNGAGLGLYIVKRIVEDFNGEIKVKSEINKGTSFEVVLPNLKEENLNND